MKIEYFFLILYFTLHFLLPKGKPIKEIKVSHRLKRIIFFILIGLTFFISYMQITSKIDPFFNYRASLKFEDIIIYILGIFSAFLEEFLRDKYKIKGFLIFNFSNFIWIFSHKILDNNFFDFQRFFYIFLMSIVLSFASILFSKIKLNYTLHVLHNALTIIIILI